MAVKKEIKIEAEEPKKVRKNLDGGGLWTTVGLMLLLLGGLAHMLPAQMDPLLKVAVAGVNLQTGIGVLSVIIALYFLLGE